MRNNTENGKGMDGLGWRSPWGVLNPCINFWFSDGKRALVAL